VDGDRYGVLRTVEFVSSQFPYSGPLVGKNYQNWTNTSVEVQFCDFFVDDELATNFPPGVDPRRNHMKDPGEEDIPGCVGIAVGPMNVYAVATYFKDVDGDNVGFPDTAAERDDDIIYQIVQSDPELFELTNLPYVNAVRPRQQEFREVIRLYGQNFGPAQMPGDSVELGNLPWRYATDSGISLQVLSWSSTMIRARLRPCYAAWIGNVNLIWVVKNNGGSPIKSNFKYVRVLNPLP
jgi:hypothetical protein